MTLPSIESTGTDPQGTGQQSTGTDPQGTGQQNDPGTETNDGTQDGQDDFDSLPEATKAEIRSLRRENRRLRTEARKGTTPPPATGQGQEPTAVLEALAKALGLDVSTLTTGKQSKDTGSQEAADQLRLAKVELGVFRVAGAVGADPDALLDSRSFLREVEDLDPSDPDFEKSLKDAAKAAVTANAALRAKAPGTTQRKTPPGKSGGDLAGGRTPQEQKFVSPQARLAAAYAAGQGT